MNWRGYYMAVSIAGILQCIFFSTAKTQQAGGIFYHLTTNNGLSSNRANKVIQDREGFYWIATQDGLNRFDGSNCKVFRNLRNDSTSLSHNNCVQLLEDEQGDIWVGTSRGVNRYNKKEKKFERYYLSHPAMLDDQVNAITGMVKDGKGNIWITSAGLWQYNIYSRQWTRYLNDPGNPASVPPGFNGWLQYDKFNEGLWMSNDGLVFFDIKNAKFYHEDYNPEKIFPFETISPSEAFVLDSSGVIWFYKLPGVQLCNYSPRTKTLHELPFTDISAGMYSGSVDPANRIWFNHWHKKAQIYDPVLNKFDTSFLAYAHRQSPLSAITTNLYIDKAGNYWISSSKGVSIYNPRAQGVKYIWLDDMGKTELSFENRITCLAEQNENTIWVGTVVGLFRYDRVERKFNALKNLPLSSPGIRCLYVHRDSILWIGGRTELLVYDLRKARLIKKILLDANPQYMTKGERNDIWMGSWSHGLFKFSASGSLIGRMTHEKNGTGALRYYGLTCYANSLTKPGFWAGYNFEHGFFKLNYNDHSVENYKIPVTSPFINSSNSVNAIAEDQNGNVWLGTYGGGLVYFDRKNHSFTTYTQSDGLKGDYINMILQDDQFNIWVTTSNGLSIIDSRTRSIINSEIDLAFDNNDFITNGIRLRNKNLIFFSGLKMVEIDPAVYLQSANPSRILVSSFKIFETEASLAEVNTGQAAIDLSYRQNFFSFEYSLLKANPQSSTSYAYKLEGFDKDWNYVKERRTAYYTNVPPGAYEFHVKATDEGGKWIYFSNPVAIKVSPPFWKTWWFIGIAALAVASGLYIFYRYRIKQVKKVFGLRSKISQDLHDEVGSTLSSIHLYSSIAAKTMNKDAAKAKDALQQINDNTRQVMENMSDIVWAINTGQIGDTTLENKLKNYGYELLSPLNIECMYAVNKEVEKKLINIEARRNILLIAKEAMNNIAKYSNATEALVILKTESGRVLLTIKDNGKGFDYSNRRKGNGLNNMRIRTEALGGKFHCSSELNKGTKVECLIPIANISDQA